MKTLAKIHEELALELKKYDYKVSEKVNFEDRKTALKSITALNLKLKTFREEVKLQRQPRFNRKQQVLDLLTKDIHSINELCTKLNISNRNVSSIICYLKTDGYKITSTRVGGETFLELNK